MKQEYLTDEELLLLIEDVEKNSLIKAPSHIKTDVFEKIDREKKQAKIVSTATYRFKVVIAMAASIGIFCTLPFKMPSQTERMIRASEHREERMEAEIKFKEKRDQIFDKIVDSINVNSIIGRIE